MKLATWNLFGEWSWILFYTCWVPNALSLPHCDTSQAFYSFCFRVGNWSLKLHSRVTLHQFPLLCNQVTAGDWIGTNYSDDYIMMTFVSTFNQNFFVEKKLWLVVIRKNDSCVYVKSTEGTVFWTLLVQREKKAQ